MSPPPITVLGAGLSGLTLGRCLLKRGIPAILYDRSSSAPRHSYGITLHPSSYRPLLALLGVDETAFRRRLSVDAGNEGMGNVRQSMMVHPTGWETGSFRANRSRLEEMLREGLDVRWEHELGRVEEGSSGVQLCFKNGDSIQAESVIAADGVHSLVRKSLIPGAEPEILPYVVFNGKRRVPRRIFEDLYSPAMHASNIVEVKRDDTVLQISISDGIEDKMSVSWIYSRPTRGPNDRLHKPNRPTTGAQDIPQELFDEVSQLQDLDQPFREVFRPEVMKEDRILHWLMRTVLVEAPRLQESAKKNVFFLGESVHAEPILGGQGANEAIVDAIELADVIAGSGSEGVSTWYEMKLATWRHGIDGSKSAIAQMHTEAKSNL